MKKRWFSTLTALALCLSLLPVGAGATGETDITTSGLTITAQDTKSGSYVTSNGGSVVVSATDGTVTITMHGATLNAPMDVTGLNAVLVLEGTNSIVPPSSQAAFKTTNGNLTIKGSGSLSAKGNEYGIIADGSLSIENTSVSVLCDSSSNTAAIQASDSITISGSTINVENATTGILATKGVSIAEKSNISINCTNIGIYSGQKVWNEDGEYWSIVVPSDIIVDNSSVQADSISENGLFATKDIIIRNNATVKGNNGYSTLYADEKIQINHSTVTATTNDAGIVAPSLTIQNGSNVTVKAVFPGIAAQAEITIDDSILEASSDNHNGIWTLGTLTISGGTTQVTATSKYSHGIYAYNNINISGDNTNVTVSNTDASADDNIPALSSGSGTLNLSGGKLTVSSAHGYAIDVVEVPEISGGTLILPGENSGIYVNADPYYYVTFDCQNGTDPGKHFVAGGTQLTPPDPAPTRDGYTFDGWYKDVSGNETWDFAQDTVTEHTTLYAKWTANTPPPTPGGSSSSGGSSSHTIAVPKVDNGSLRVDPLRASQGRSVTITATPNDGYQLDSLNVKDAKGNPCTLTDLGEGTYSFTMPGSAVEIEAIFVPIPEAPWVNPYTDVDSEAWYYEAVAFVSAKGWMGGYGDTHFGPGAQLSRAQLAQILYNQAETPATSGSSDFSDVERGAWYHSAICWAVEQGIVGGYGDGRFGPDDPITREQLAVMLWRGAGQPTPPNLLLTFPDADQASDYALDALRWAVEQGVLSGKSGGLLDPQGQATRAEAAQMLRNLFQ